MIDVVGNRYPFNGQPAMAAVVHPTRVVRFHLQRVDERIFITIFDEILRKAFMAILKDHRHNVFTGS